MHANRLDSIHWHILKEPRSITTHWFTSPNDAKPYTFGLIQLKSLVITPICRHCSNKMNKWMPNKRRRTANPCRSNGDSSDLSIDSLCRVVCWHAVSILCWHSIFSCSDGSIVCWRQIYIDSTRDRKTHNSCGKSDRQRKNTHTNVTNSTWIISLHTVFIFDS